MALWKKSLMTTAYLDGNFPDVDEPCEVRIDSVEIVVCYIEDNQPILYRGINDRTGHFKLTCDENNGKATLHLVKDENLLEGYWIESGYEGFWRIKLDD